MMEPLQTYALTGATVIDGHGGAPLNDTTVLVDNGVIKAVGSSESIVVEDNILGINVGGHFILPGLIDVHVHIVGVGSPELLDNRPLYQYFFPFHSSKGSLVCLKI